jgi:hypothetical protein
MTAEMGEESNPVTYSTYKSFNKRIPSLAHYRWKSTEKLKNIPDPVNIFFLILIPINVDNI